MLQSGKVPPARVENNKPRYRCFDSYLGALGWRIRMALPQEKFSDVPCACGNKVKGGTNFYVCRRCNRRYHNSCVLAHYEADKKKDQPLDTSRDDWLCFYCCRGSPVSSKNPWLELHCIVTFLNVYLYVEDGGSYERGDIVKRNEDLSTVDIELRKISSEGPQTRSTGPVLPVKKIVSVYPAPNLRGHMVDISPGTRADLFWILTSGHGGAEIKGACDLFRISAWDVLDSIPLSSQLAVASIAERIIPPTQGSSLESVMYWTSNYPRVTNLTPQSHTTFISLVYIGQFGVSGSENDSCSMTLEFTPCSVNKQPMQHQTYMFENPGHAYTVKTNGNMSTYIKAREGNHEVLVLWWCIAAEQGDEGANQSNQKPVRILKLMVLRCF